MFDEENVLDISKYIEYPEDEIIGVPIRTRFIANYKNPPLCPK